MNSLQLAWENTFWLIIINLIFSRGLFMLFPAYVNARFSPIPKVNHYNKLNVVVFVLIAVYSLFMPFSANKIYIIAGVLSFATGLSLMIAGIFWFAINEPDRLVQGGIYKIMRHPVYIGTYFQIFGVAIISQSIIIMIFLIFHIIFQHKIILQEEIDLENTYGNSYKSYKQKVKAYMFF